MKHEILSIFRMSAEKIQVTLISVKNNEYFTLRSMYVYDSTVSRWILLRLRNVSDKRCREMFNNFFVKIVPFMRYRGKTWQPERPQMAIWRTRFACRITKATNTHSELIISIAFQSPKTVTRTPLYVTLYVYCLSCIDFVRHFIILIEKQDP
jgi:hypothetical protein